MTSSLTTPATPSTSSPKPSLAWRMVQSPHRWPVLVIVLAVVLGNGLYLAHIFNPDPLNLISGIGEVTKPGVFFGSVAADPNNGITAQSLGHLVAVDWFSGHIPWWNPYEGLGAPLAGEMQAGAFFPPTLLLYFADGQVYAHALVELVAGLSTYALLYRLRLGRPAAVAGAVAFALNGTYAWFSHAPTNPVCFLPLLLLGIELAADAASARRPLGWGTIGVALAMSLYAGFPETAYIDGVLAALWVVVRIIMLSEDRWRFVGKVSKGAALGVLLGAPILVAFLDYLSVADVGSHSGVFGGAFLPHAALPQTITPYVYGPIDAFSNFDKTNGLTIIWGNTGGYLSAALILLGLVGLVGSRFRLLRIALALWVVLCLGRTYGVAPLLHIINALPAMKDVAFFRYANPSWEMAVIVLAAFGLDDIVRKLVPRWWIALCTVGVLGLVMAAHFGARAVLDHVAAAPDAHHWELAALAWGLFISVAIGAVALVGRGRTRSVLLACVLGADVLAAFVIPQLSAPKAAHIDDSSVQFLKSHLGTYRYFSLGPLSPDYGSYFGLSSLDVNDLPVPKVWGTYVTHKLDPNADPTVYNGSFEHIAGGPDPEQEFLAHITTFEDAGVKYLITFAHAPVPTTPSGLRLHLVFANPSMDVFAVPNPEPMFSVRGGGCLVNAAGVDSVTVDCPSPHALVRRELIMPGWKATVNGKSESVRSYDHVFEQVELPAGITKVHFTFAPPHIDLALPAFAVGLLVLGILPVVLRRRARR